MLFFLSRCQRQDFTKKTPERIFTKTFAGIPGSSVRLEDSKISVYLNRLDVALSWISSSYRDSSSIAPWGHSVRFGFHDITCFFCGYRCFQK